jgi:signal transduction histidine kinase
MVLTQSKHKDAFSAIRIKLFMIIIGTLLTIWIILLSLVYSLMATQLYEVLDNSLLDFATHTIHLHMNGSTTSVRDNSNSKYNFSLWQKIPGNAVQYSIFIDGNPFVSPASINKVAQNQPDGVFRTIHIEGIPYRSFFAIIHSKHGDYLIRVTTQTAATDTTLSNLLWTLGLVGFVALAITIVIGVWLSSRILSPSINSWKRQQQFVADASHELRTPLTIIKTNLEVLLHHPEHTIDSELHWLGNAYSEVLRTTTLIEDLLTLARADSMEVLIEHKEIDLSALVHEVADTVSPLAEDQGKNLQLATPEFPCKTIGDTKRLRQLLLILLDNALKYTNTGDTISITVGCDTNFAQIAVQDTGVGIPPDQLPKIFDRFMRGDSSRHRDNQGSGLGLSIAKWIVDAHHGFIFANSTVQKGSVFTVRLPS